MLRTVIITLAGFGYFVASILLMMPLRMAKNPVVNYNLFYVPFLLTLLGFLFYRCCTEERQSKAGVYGFFGGIVAWQLFGELASISVDRGVITQFSDVNIKEIGGYFYLIGGWIGLKVLWLTRSIKAPVALLLLTFLGIWTFALYMENYSTLVPVEMMPIIAYTVGVAAALLSVALLVVARRSRSPETRNAMGALLFLSVSLVLMGFGPWKRPQSFYLEHEPAHIQHQIDQLKKRKDRIERLRQQLSAKSESSRAGVAAARAR
jgi:hypothetical protein